MKMSDEEQENRRNASAQKKREQLEIALGAGENPKLLDNVAQKQLMLEALGITHNLLEDCHRWWCLRRDHSLGRW